MSRTETTKEIVRASDPMLEAIARRLRRRIERLRQRDEAERQRVLERARTVSSVAQSFPGIRQLYLFGSVLMPGRFSFETSDVDIGLLGSLGVEFFTLGAALDRHFDRTVDLVEIDRATPLGQWILTQGVCIYDAQQQQSSRAGG